MIRTNRESAPRVLSNKGFSLVELMVVVAIIGILSAIAIPQINKYMARARQTEAKTNLASIYTANKAFYAEFNIYDNRFDVIGYRPEGKLRYNLGWADTGTQCVLGNYGYTGAVGSSAINAVGQCGTGALPGAAGCIVLTDGNKTLLNTALDCTTSFRAAAISKISTSTNNDDRWSIDQVKVLNNDNDGTQ